MLTLAKFEPGLLKQFLKSRKKLKELEIMHQMQSMSVLLDIIKFADMRDRYKGRETFCPQPPPFPLTRQQPQKGPS